jgi:phosphoribosylanthranilate isomerase
MKIKICGITNEADAEAAWKAGADALGFVHYAKSPRHVPAERIARIVATLPPFVSTVAVMVNPTRKEIEALERQAAVTHWQLHGDESAEFVATLAPRRVIKAIRLPFAGHALDLAYPVGGFLLDTPCQEYGGSGKTFDWDLVDDFRALTIRPLILSGGLTSDNVAEAIRRVQPYGIDVSSGVESAPGIKDHEKIREFIARCRQVPQSL